MDGEWNQTSAMEFCVVHAVVSTADDGRTSDPIDPMTIHSWTIQQDRHEHDTPDHATIQWIRASHVQSL